MSVRRRLRGRLGPARDGSGDQSPRRVHPVLSPRGKRRRWLQGERRLENLRERHMGRRQRAVHHRGVTAESRHEAFRREFALEASHSVRVGGRAHQGDPDLRVQQRVQERRGAPPVRGLSASAHDGPARTHFGGGTAHRGVDVVAVRRPVVARPGLAWGVVHRLRLSRSTDSDAAIASTIFAQTGDPPLRPSIADTAWAG